MNSKRSFIIILLLFVLAKNISGQIISNGDFSSGTTSWGCGAETNAESVYGGGTSNSVAEVDAAAGLCQTISGLTIGNHYVLSFVATRRTGGCPSPAITNVDITVSGGALSTTVTRTNTTFGYTTSSYLFIAGSTMHTITFAGGSGFGGSTCGMIIDNISVSFSPLPIELLNFDGSYKNNRVEFEWSTATEKNNNYFEIEKSANGSDYEKISTLPSKSYQGNSSSKLDYKSEDLNPAEGVNYYRLKQVDFDKSFSFSKVIAVISALNKESKLYPNPNNGEFTIEAGNTGLTRITIVNYLGKIVYTELQNVGKENNPLKINVKDKLTSAMYRCIISSENYNHSFNMVVE